MIDVVREWRQKADNDLDTAFREILRGNDAHLDLVCYLCQQGIEKLMKGALIARRVVPPKTHDLVSLHRLLAGAEPAWRWDENELQWLTMCATVYRYPGERASRATAEQAVDTARRLRSALAPLFPASQT
jgi:HEPN domain-containing protein